MDDLELFERIKSHDREAFNTLFRNYYTALCRFSYALCLSQDDAEESVQDMFFNLWEKAPSLEIATSVKAYLYASARNTTLNAIKKKQVELKNLNAYHESSTLDDAPDENDINEIGRFIKAGVETLPNKCKEIFVLCKYEGLTYEEIAEYLDVSNKTVENQMGIALRKLREFLGDKLYKKQLISLLFIFALGVLLWEVVLVNSKSFIQ